MTAVAGFDLAALAGSASAGTGPSGAGQLGKAPFASKVAKGALSSSTAKSTGTTQASVLTQPVSFRDGFQALLQTGLYETEETQPAAGSQSTTQAGKQSEANPASSLASGLAAQQTASFATEFEASSLRTQLPGAQTAHPLATLAQTPPTQSTAPAGADKAGKDEQTHATNRTASSSHFTSASSSKPASQPQTPLTSVITAPVPIPAASPAPSHAVSAAPILTQPAQPSKAVLSTSPASLAQNASPKTSPITSPETSRQPAQADQESGTALTASTAQSASASAAAQTDSASPINIIEPYAEVPAPVNKPLRAEPTATQTTQSSESLAKQANNEAVATPGGIQSAPVSAPVPVNGAPKPRVSAPLQHDAPSQIAEPPVANPVQTGTAIVRDAATLPATSANSAASTPSTATPTAHDTFAALDSSPGQPQTTWTSTTPRHAEAGFLDPSLGWISVRADATSSGLHAAVVPSSPEAAQALGSHLAGLNTFLAERHGSSVTASLASPEDRSSASGQGNSGSANREAQQQSQGGAQSSASPAFSSSTTISAATSSAQYAEIATIPARTGGISVLA